MTSFRTIFTAGIVAVGLTGAAPAFAHGPGGAGGGSAEDGPPCGGYGYGYNMGPGMMGPGMMGYMMGPGYMMGRGGYGGGPGYGYMMGPGYGRGYMMGPGAMPGGGYGGPGYGYMMGRGYGPGMGGPGYQGYMGPGMQGQGMQGPGMQGQGMQGQGMGPGMMNGQGQSQGQPALSTEEVTRMMEQRLAWMGNPNVKLGKVEAKDDDTIIAEIVTKDGSLVQKLAINRHTGWMQPADR